MTSMMDVFDLENPVFRAWVFWCTVMVVKMMLMSPLTGMNRYKNKTFANEEDAKTFKNLKPKFDDPDVERIRRAHRNDMENIPAFITISFFFMLTSPSEFLAINLFRAAGISRIVHTLVYAIYPMQPHRALSWALCYGITLFMGVKVLFAFI